MSDPVLDAAPDAVMTIDEHGVLLEFNAAAERLFGYACADAIGRSVADLVIPEPFRAAHQAGLRRAVEGGPTHILGRSAELCAQHADGREIPVWVSLTRTSVDPPRFTAWMRELVEHKGGRAEADRMAGVAQEPAAVGSWEWIPAEATLRWSDNVFRMLGAEPGEVEPSFEYFLARVHPDDRERVIGEARDVRGHAEASDWRVRIVRPDGQVRHLSASVAVTEWRGGEPHRLLGRFEDLTERLRSQRGIAAHIAVETALSGWDGFERGGERLLGGLADALGYEAGVLWVRNNDTLVARVLWQGAAAGHRGLVAVERGRRLRRGSGRAGQAWRMRTPVHGSDADAKVGSWLAIPAIDGREVLAVMELAAREEGELSESLRRSLTGLGYELGAFLGQRREELAAPLPTPRELEILGLAARGLSAPEIAARLVISPGTVRTHFQNVYPKLGVSDRASAVATALREGLID